MLNKNPQNSRWLVNGERPFGKLEDMKVLFEKNLII